MLMFIEPVLYLYNKDQRLVSLRICLSRYKTGWHGSFGKIEWTTFCKNSGKGKVTVKKLSLNAISEAREDIGSNGKRDFF